MELILNHLTTLEEKMRTDDFGLDINNIEPNKIDFEFGWSSYEEGESNLCTLIKEGDKYTITQNTSGYSVEGGEYDTTETFSGTEEEIINYINEEML